jgi:hypothetical protein
MAQGKYFNFVATITIRAVCTCGRNYSRRLAHCHAAQQDAKSKYDKLANNRLSLSR